MEKAFSFFLKFRYERFNIAKTRLHLRKVLLHTYCLYKLLFLIIENELLFDLNVKKRNVSFVTVFKFY